MLCFSAHGKYELSVNGQMVLCHYSDGFNQAGVIELAEAILSYTHSFERWVLFQYPEPSAGITNDAIETMMNCYLSFQQSGCIAVGIVENSLFVHAGKPYRPKSLTMPILINKDPEHVLSWLSKSLES